MSVSSVAELIEEVRVGRMVILVDDEDRENEGDLVCAADYITPQLVNFMACEARGLVCLALTSEQVDRLALPLMIGEERNKSPNRTAFTVSIEAAHGVTTGISAADRALTIKVASGPSAKPGDVITPGHVFPIRAQSGGVLRRAGHTEASVDLVRMAGLNPAAVICEVMNADGTMARFPQLLEFARKHNIKIGTIESLIRYRIENESFVEVVASAPLASRFGAGFQVRVFENKLDNRQHLAIIKGRIHADSPTLVRVHTANVLDDVLGCNTQRSQSSLQLALQRIDREGSGVLVYLNMDNMQERLVDALNGSNKAPFTPDERDYGVGAQILRALGVRNIRLLTNSPAKKVGLKGYGLEIVDCISLDVSSHAAQTGELTYEL